MTLANLDKLGDIMPHRQAAGAGGGSVNSVTAGDATITIGGSAADPTVAVGTITPGSNGTIALSANAPASVSLAAAGGGSGTAASKDDHVHQLSQAIAPTWTGAHLWQTNDAGTTTVTTLASLSHLSSGTPAAAFGVSMNMKLHSSANALRTAGEIGTVWSTATDGAEVSSIFLKTLLAGAATETVRFGTGASLPDSDFPVSMGRVLVDSRTTDRACFSHRDSSATTEYAIQQLATGETRVNSKTGTNLLLRAGDTTRVQINGTGIGFFATAAVALQTGPTLSITNSVTSGGTDGTIANYTDLTIYANDAAAIRNDLYQLARAVKFASDALRAYGLLT